MNEAIGIYDDLPSASSRKVKVYSGEDASRRNNRISKMIVTERKIYSGFLTLSIPKGSEHNNPVAFARAVQRLANALEYIYPGSFWDYWVELSNAGTLHLHSLFWINGRNRLFNIRALIYDKWSKIISCPDQNVVDVRSFHRNHLGYCCKKSKHERTIRLLEMMNGKRSYGTIMSRSKGKVKSRVFAITESQAETIQKFLIARMYQKAKLHSHSVNRKQLARIDSGWFAHHFMSHEDYGAIELMCLYDEVEAYYVGVNYMVLVMPEADDDMPFPSDDAERAYFEWEEQFLAGRVYFDGMVWREVELSRACI